MIKWRPPKEEIAEVLENRLAMVVTRTYERILIGTEENIRRRLDGQQDAVLEYDEIRPFGTLLLSLDEDDNGDWGTAVFKLLEAQEILHASGISKAISGKRAPVPEKAAQEILAEKCDSEDPICQFVAARIWYGYWICRENRSPDKCESFLKSMLNLIRPFAYRRSYVEEQVRVISSSSIFHHPQELSLTDWECTICHVNDETEEYIIVDQSLIPLEKYYLSKFEKWKKYIVRCRMCNRLFLADSLRYELCSDECRNQARRNNMELRKQDEDTSEIDRICINASAHWYNRLTKMKKSAECSDEDVEKYAIEKERFLKEKRKKRQAYKKDKISYTELRDWLLQQEAEAQAVMESIWLHKGDSATKSE